METSATKLHLDQIRALKLLGKGATGTVFLVHDSVSDSSASSPFALKLVDKASASSLRRAKWETQILRRLSDEPNPFLPRLLATSESSEFFAWAMPYCSGGDLNVLRHRQNDGVFSSSVIKFYLAEILCALDHLHSMGIAYRDLKPENILLQESGHVTLTDFDLSCSLNKPTRPEFYLSDPEPDPKLKTSLRFFRQKKKTKSARVNPITRRRMSFSGGERSNSFVGTDEYISPEVIRGDGHDFAVDWWALGVLTYEMMYGATPFKGRSKKETFRNVLMKEPEFPGKPSDLTDLIRRLLAKDPTRRLGFRRGAAPALQSPREIDGDLVHAYLARRALDYLIGFNISPLLWRKLPGCPSAGRVQSAALALICDRESEIDGFKPQEYWTVGIKVQGKDSSSTVSAHLTSLNSKKLNQLSISSEEDAQDIEQRIRSEGFLVKGIKKSTTRRNPPTPYITSTLQQDAANKLHFSSAYTMKLAQKLYEGVQLSDGNSAGLITYMRTDGLHIADEAIKDIQSLVAERYGENFTSDGPRKYFKKVKNAQEAHEAIRPTNIRRLPSTIASLLDSDSLKLYTLIWSRSVACQMEPASVVQIQVDIGNASESIIFRSSCSKVVFLGYQAVYEDPETKTIKTKDDEKSSEREETFETLSLLKDWDPLHIGEVELKQHHTQPPPRYSEGSLIKKLEELGIGRPSTYASIFKVLQDRKYLTIKSRVLYPEFRGRMVSAFLTNYFTEVTDYSFTADMETELDNVSGGVTNWKGLLRDYWTRFSAYCKRVENVQIQQVEKMLEKKYEDFLFSSLPDPTRTCPSCSEGTLIFKVSKFGTGYFIGCDGYPSCKFIAKTLYGEDEDEDDSPRNTCVEEPKLLGLHPNTNEKVILKCGPYGYYVQLGEDKKGHLPKRANAAHIKDVSSITLESALELLRYPLTLGTHPEDGQPVTLKLSKSGFTVRHRRTMATVPKNTEPSEVTLEKAMKLLSGKNVRLCGRPKRIKPTVDEESEGDEVVEAM